MRITDIRASLQPNQTNRKAVKNRALSRRRLAVVLTALLLLSASAYFLAAQPALALYQQAKLAKPHLKNLKSALTAQNLPQISAEIDELKRLRLKTEKTYQRLAWLRLAPWISNYYRDGQRVLRAGEAGLQATETVLSALEPFEEVLGLTGASGTALSVEEKLAQLTVISPQLIPEMEKALQDIRLVRGEVIQIDPARYPREVKGFPVRENLISAIAALDNAEKLLNDAGPFLQALPQALGAAQPQTYLILLQNDKELRPTGGFITAYALAQMDKGRFSILKSDDIYNLDRDQTLLPAPDAVTRFLKVDGFFMRDTNFSPDFKKSIGGFLLYYNQTGAPPVEGILAIDTQFVESFLEISGPLEVPGYSQDFSGFPNLPNSCRQGGTAFTEENIVCRLELYAERINKEQLGQRKELIGDLMGRLVSWLLSAPPEKWSPILQNLIKQAQTKHLLVYFEDEALQKLAEDYYFAGQLREDFELDFIHVSDANLAGAKSDLYMHRQYDLEVKVNDEGKVMNRLTLTYTNTGFFDGWLNTTNRDYVRIYVPKGAKLIGFSGGTIETSSFDELGKTVFDNFLLTQPQKTGQFVVEYELPFKVEKKKLGFSLRNYSLLIQKQPGKEAEEWRISVNGQERVIQLDKDERVELKI